MRKFMATLAVAALTVGALSGAAIADSSPQTREATCKAMAIDPDVTATYLPGSPSTVNSDRCEVVSIATTVEEAAEQVNNERAARAVVRTVKTTSSVTTTQLYKWDTGASAGWIADGDPRSEIGEQTYQECLITPGLEKCS